MQQTVEPEPLETISIPVTEVAGATHRIDRAQSPDTAKLIQSLPVLI